MQDSSNSRDRTVRAASITIIVLLLAPAGGRNAGFHTCDGGLSLHQVFEQNFPFPEDESPFAVFDPSGTLFYLVEPSAKKVRVINWRERREIRSRSYLELCRGIAEHENHSIEAWIPTENGILFHYCHSLYLIDPESLGIKYEFPSAEKEKLGIFSISPDSNLVAVEIVEGDRLSGNTKLRVYDLVEGGAHVEFPIDGFLSELAFTSDSEHLIGQIERIQPPRAGERVAYRVGCKLVLWKTATWEAANEKRYCVSSFSPITFLPNRPRLFLEVLPSKLRIRDLESGDVIQTIEADRSLSSVVVSHDGQWVAASVADDPADAPEYAQDFRIWDLETGQVLFETPKRKWPLFAGVDFAPYVRLSVSRDDRYLLVTKFEKVSVYQIESLCTSFPVQK